METLYSELRQEAHHDGYQAGWAARDGEVARLETLLSIYEVALADPVAYLRSKGWEDQWARYWKDPTDRFPFYDTLGAMQIQIARDVTALMSVGAAGVPDDLPF